MAAIRVVVVDDSAVLRRLVSLALRAAGDIDVVGTAENGAVALERVQELRPDLITMDIEMPVLDGITAVRELRRRRITTPVVMFSTLTENGARATLAALAAGATHYVTKPSGSTSAGSAMAAVRDELVPIVRALVPHSGAAVPAQPSPRTVVRERVALPPAAGGARLPASPPRTPDVVAIGSSTGGPEALVKVLTALPADLSVPVVITQHMPPLFTAQLAARLDRLTPLRVREAAQNDQLRPGEALLAPGDWHLEVTRGRGPATARLVQSPPENHCRPAVDVMLRSLVTAYGAGVLAVILTGMGSDGRVGCAAVRSAGGHVLAQDKQTSVVWGMPGSVVGDDLAHQVLPLEDIGAAITSACSRPHRPAAVTTRARAGA